MPHSARKWVERGIYGALIVEEVKRLQKRGEVATFSKLYERLRVSTRTLSRYLKLLEGRGIITRHRLGKHKIIMLNDFGEREITGHEILKKAFKGSLLEYAFSTHEFLKLLVETYGKRRLLGTEFANMTYERFFSKYELRILGILLELAKLRPLGEKDRAIYYALFRFLKQNVRTMPLEVLTFFPLYRLPREMLRGCPPKLQLIINHVPRLLYPLITKEDEPLLDFEEKVEADFGGNR
jgi:DNA-binding MarR family transcriptional regulator